MHGTDFLIDLDVSHPGDVATAASLDLGILSGVQLLPPLRVKTSANRLLVFTGTAVCNARGFADSDEIARGVVRVRLGYQLNANRRFQGSAVFAALANLFGQDGQDASVFAVDLASVVTDPVDGQLHANNLPSNELYMILDVAVGESGSQLKRISYQANVLVSESEPDIQSLLVSNDGIYYSPHATVAPGAKWWLEVTMTGPVPVGQTFTVKVRSSDENHVPTGDSYIHGNGATITYAFFGSTVNVSIPPNPVVTITALGKHVVKTATLRIDLPK